MPREAETEKDATLILAGILQVAFILAGNDRNPPSFAFELAEGFFTEAKRRGYTLTRLGG